MAAGHIQSSASSHSGFTMYPSFGLAGDNSNRQKALSPNQVVPNQTATKKVPSFLKCGDQECTTVASFGKPGTKKREFCARHRLKGMVNVISKRCEESGCPKQASYGSVDARRREFCRQHARQGMVNVHWNRCIEPRCTKQAAHPVDGTLKKKACAAHAKGVAIRLIEQGGNHSRSRRLVSARDWSASSGRERDVANILLEFKRRR